MISERPAEAEDRAVPGHWEDDPLIGLARSTIGTVVERKTRLTILLHLPREDGYRHKETPTNDPALAGYGAIAMKNALANTMSTLSRELARSVTRDRGKEMSVHAQFRVETGIPVFFADPSRHGSEAPTRTQMACYASTSRRAPTYPVGRPMRLQPSLTHSTPGQGRRSTGRHPPKRSTSTYCCSNNPALHPPVEPCQFRSRKFVAALHRQGMAGSMGKVGAARDNAAMELFLALLQKNVLNRRAWRTREKLAIAMVTWIERTNHRRRRQAALGRLLLSNTS